MRSYIAALLVFMTLIGQPVLASSVSVACGDIAGTDPKPAPVPKPEEEPDCE
jgi:hypothetical protein